MVFGRRERVRSWEGIGGSSNHRPILHHMYREEKKPLSLYKFNSFWLANEEYMDLVVRESKHFIEDGELAMK
jgi:hypothetical protein